MRRKIIVSTGLLAMIFMIVGCSAPISTREQGGLIGAGLGAGTGAIIGSTVGHAAVGALIGGPVGLIAGALMGDHLMGLDRTRQHQSVQSDQNQQEIERLRRENKRLQDQRTEW